jgi:hypothetical protein
MLAHLYTASQLGQHVGVSLGLVLACKVPVVFAPPNKLQQCTPGHELKHKLARLASVLKPQRRHQVGMLQAQHQMGLHQKLDQRTALQCGIFFHIQGCALPLQRAGATSTDPHDLHRNDNFLGAAWQQARRRAPPPSFAPRGGSLEEEAPLHFPKFAAPKRLLRCTNVRRLQLAGQGGLRDMRELQPQQLHRLPPPPRSTDNNNTGSRRP